MVRALFVSNAVSSELRKAITALAGRWSNTECVEGCGLEIQNCDFYVGRTTDGHYGRASRVLVKGDVCRTYWKTFGRYWWQIMNVSKCLDKATSPCFTLGKRRGLLSLISHSMKVLKSRYQQAARHFFKVGNIYVGRALNLSRAVGSELRMTKFTLVERRMTKWATSTLVER